MDPNLCRNYPPVAFFPALAEEVELGTPPRKFTSRKFFKVKNSTKNFPLPPPTCDLEMGDPHGFCPHNPFIQIYDPRMGGDPQNSDTDQDGPEIPLFDRETSGFDPPPPPRRCTFEKTKSGLRSMVVPFWRKFRHSHDSPRNSCNHQGSRDMDKDFAPRGGG